MKKRSVSLIEVLVCLTLFTFLIGTLFFWYRSFSTQKERFQQLKWPLMEERYAFQRLQTLLPLAEQPFFSVEQDGSLVFLFDRGPWVNPLLSGRVLARLYHDPNQQCLCLGIWPDPTKEEEPIRSPSQTFVLLEGVERLSFSFYHPPDLLKKPVDPDEVGKPRPIETWQTNWDARYAQLPAFIKLTITRKATPSFDKRDITYTFDLPSKIILPSEAV